jgi:hypothetical protein
MFIEGGAPKHIREREPTSRNMAQWGAKRSKLRSTLALSVTPLTLAHQPFPLLDFGRRAAGDVSHYAGIRLVLACQRLELTIAYDAQ